MSLTRRPWSFCSGTLDRGRWLLFQAEIPLDLLEKGLDTVIGERGLGISGGEAQRVALARAFLDSAPLLVLDEPTAHLDAETEAAVIKTIAALARGKTLVLATHGVAPLALCERVLSLDEGRLLDPSSLMSPIALPEEVFHA